MTAEIMSNRMGRFCSKSKRSCLLCPDVDLILPSSSFSSLFISIIFNSSNTLLETQSFPCSTYSQEIKVWSIELNSIERVLLISYFLLWTTIVNIVTNFLTLRTMYSSQRGRRKTHKYIMPSSGGCYKENKSG